MPYTEESTQLGRSEVVITAIDIGFWRLVALLFKISVASVPAMILVGVFWLIVGGLMAGLFAGLAGGLAGVGAVQ